MIKILDVTLRDGGYRTNFHFSESHVKNIISALDTAAIDYIEVGYRGGSFKPLTNIGNTGNTTNEYLSFIKKHIPTAKLGVIYHPRNIQLQEIEEMHNHGVNLLRCCFDINNINYSLQLIKKAKILGLISCVNFTRISQFPQKKLLEYAELSSNAGADVIYVADSNGSLLPNDVARIINALKNITDLEIGFHAHNNLNLALPNAIAAINSGATFIDSSLRGMGKGAGNLSTEFWVAYLINSKINTKYNLGIIFEAVEYLTNNLQDSAPNNSLLDMMSGSLDYSIDEQDKLHNINFRDFNAILFNKSNKTFMDICL